MVALATTALFIPAANASMVELLGAPKPVRIEWRRAAIEGATVLGSSIHEDHAIYLWLRFDDDAEPKYYSLPWDREQALELQAALREAEANRGEVGMRSPFEPDGNDAPVFHALPPPPSPPKQPAGADA